MKSVEFDIVQGLDREIIQFERATGEHGAVDKDYASKVEKGHSHLCIRVNTSAELARRVSIDAIEGGASRDDIESTIREAAVSNSALASEITENTKFGWFNRSSVSHASYLGSIGVFSSFSHYYLATPEVIDALHANAIMDDKAAENMRAALAQEFSVSLVDKLAEQGLVDTEDRGRGSVADNLKKPLLEALKKPRPLLIPTDRDDPTEQALRKGGHIR